MAERAVIVSSPSPNPSRAFSPAPGRSSSADAPPQPQTILLAAGDDATGDAGAESPGYADLRYLRLESSGPTAIVSVVMGGALPPSPSSDELIFIGVDLYRQGRKESDYQFLAQGSSDGWFAYVDTPNGYVPYPGSFEMNGNSAIFEVPWNSIGSPLKGEISAYCDWSRKRLVLNQASSDRLPDATKIVFER